MAHYTADTLIQRRLEQASRFELWTGGLAFAILLPLATTQFNELVRRMGPKPSWTLQRWIYAAAVLTVLRWAALHGWREALPAIARFAPLALHGACRIWWYLSRWHPMPA
ncbi:hypothetical protein [Aliiruegeria haliotis]|uniref:hypothetical protein n=1 Tax=Aliiruegeria haliotis TaxID=1280846 RepID=UPI0011B286F6|nr:hypothetical protein [Aliiruegeria haliotis]